MKEPTSTYDSELKAAILQLVYKTPLVEINPQAWEDDEWVAWVASTMPATLPEIANLLGLEITTKKGTAFDLAIGFPMGTPESSVIIGAFNFNVCENGLMVTLVKDDNENNWSCTAYAPHAAFPTLLEPPCYCPETDMDGGYFTGYCVICEPTDGGVYSENK